MAAGGFEDGGESRTYVASITKEGIEKGGGTRDEKQGGERKLFTAGVAAQETIEL